MRRASWAFNTSPGCPSRTKPRGTLKQKAARIKVELALGSEITTAGAILRAANEAMELVAEGTLPAQADRLLAAIGI